MDMLNLIISLVSGIIGGNATGAAMKEKSLGPLGNSLTGLFGGGAGGYLAQILGLIGTAGVAAAPGAVPGTEGLDIASFITNVASSGIGGAVLTAIVALIKNSMQKPT